MNDFHTALSYVGKVIYEPNHLHVQEVEEEKHNSNYGAGRFRLGTKTARFRVARVTPTKAGQFVAFWEKDAFGKNVPYAYRKAPDLLIVTVFGNDRAFGQFIIPKDVLLERNVLQSCETTGKMGMRVYPGWDRPVSKQAERTQAWQLPYFVDMSAPDNLPVAEIAALFT